MRIKRTPNLQLRKIVLEETNDGRDIVRFLKNVIAHIEDGPQTFGIRPQDFARTHKIAAARILARLGLEDGKRYLRRNYVRTPFRRVHPEEEDEPRRDTAAATANLYRLVRKETKDGADIILYFIRIIKGLHPEYKPHLRMAAAKELIRQIEFDYEDSSAGAPTPEPTRTQPPVSEPVGASLVDAHDPQPASTNAAPIRAESTQKSAAANTAASTEPTNADNPITAHHQNPTNHSSDNQPNPVNPTYPINPAPDIDNSPPPRPHHDYAKEHCAEEEESIYRSIIRRAADRPDLDSACREAERLIAEFNRYATDRNPAHNPVAVPADLLAESLTQRMEAPETYLFEPADYYDLDRDDFYYCLCENCDECEEVEFFMETMRELEDP